MEESLYMGGLRRRADRKQKKEGGAFQKMIHGIYKKYAGLLLAFLAAFLLMPNVADAEGYSCTVSIPAEVSVTGESAPSEKFTVLLEEEGENVPMPEQTEAVIQDSGNVQFGPITYTAPGDYRYRVFQKAGTTEDFTYDTTAYTVTVRVVNNGNGGLAAEIWAIEDGSQNKTDRITFGNSYKAPEAVKDPQKPVQETPKADPAKSSTKAVAKTGDTADLAVPFAVALAAGVLIIATWKAKKRNSIED